MGKYARKAKVTAGVALTADVSQSYLGVRTRTKTLALQRLPSTSAAALPPAKSDSCYLQLRSRRLEKPMQPHCSPNTRLICGDKYTEIGSRGEADRERWGIDASFEENSLDFDVSERGTRESSPCSSIRGGDTTMQLASMTNQSCSSVAAQRVQDAALLMNAYAPSASELEEFFAREEQSMQRHFIEKYNFDVVGDSPLPGRYEWVAVRP